MGTVKTRSRAKSPPMIPGGGPFKQSTSEDATKSQYEDKAKAMLRQVIKDQGADYAKLQAGLAKLGVSITPAALENKIARGTFSAAFLLQCMDALGAKVVNPAD